MEETAISSELCGGLCFSACLMLINGRDIGWTETSVLESIHRTC